MIIPSDQPHGTSELPENTGELLGHVLLLGITRDSEL